MWLTALVIHGSGKEVLSEEAAGSPGRGERKKQRKKQRKELTNNGRRRSHRSRKKYIISAYEGHGKRLRNHLEDATKTNELHRGEQQRHRRSKPAGAGSQMWSQLRRPVVEGYCGGERTK